MNRRKTKEGRKIGKERGREGKRKERYSRWHRKQEGGRICKFFWETNCICDWKDEVKGEELGIKREREREQMISKLEGVGSSESLQCLRAIAVGKPDPSWRGRKTGRPGKKQFQEDLASYQEAAFGRMAETTPLLMLAFLLIVRNASRDQSLTSKKILHQQLIFVNFC